MQKRMDFIEIERKWQSRWDLDKIFEANVKEEKGKERKFYINVAYPYPSGAMHVGHGRTYTVPDVIARFKRMCGYNVLFPMAFHVTGTPVIGVSNRIKRGDESVIKLYRDLYKVPESELREFVDSYKIVSYFSAEYKDIMDRMGYLIDWRRRFTTVDAAYKKFIEWQYYHLMKKGYITKGEHPVKYCPSCKNPVGDHDLLSGERASILEFFLIKFLLKEEKIFIPTATLRPETIYGVTNLWINPNYTYVRAFVSKGSEEREEWIISEECIAKLIHQGYEVKVEKGKGGGIRGEELVGKRVISPLDIDRKKIEILPASFVDPAFGTGIVMSVPAHAPFDFVALEDLHKENKYLEILPISIIKIEGYGGIPAKDVVQRMGIKEQKDMRLEDATEELYAAEYNKGEMLVGYEGMGVKEAREKVKEELLDANKGCEMYEFSGRPVICRCNTPVFVSLLKDQWFLRYSDEGWKEEVKKCFSNINVFPEEIKADFLQTIDWLREWACTRRVGLGTTLPWDKGWIVEPLSDSTIYMAYYTIAHHLKAFDPNVMGIQFFDYIFLGLEREKMGIEVEELKKIREEFLYWYPYDCRFSARDLVGNHLTFQLFHHVAVFPMELCPQGMIVFGMAKREGKKMSSSKGNIVLLSDVLSKYGADAVRMCLMSSSEPWQDFDWRDDFAYAARRQIERFWSITKEIMEIIGEEKKEKEAKEKSGIDKWMLSRMQIHIKETNKALERFQCRKALQHAYFDVENDLRWYKKRSSWKRSGAKSTLRYVLDTWVRLLSPFIPHICEEIWSGMGREGYVSLAKYPEVNLECINKEVEIAEEIFSLVYEDINEIIKVTNIKPSKIVLYMAEEWKKKAFRIILQYLKEGKYEFKEIMRILMKNAEIKRRGKEVPEFVKRMINRIKEKGWEERVEIVEIGENKILQEDKVFLENEFSCVVEIYNTDYVGAEEDPQNRSRMALPTRPAIFVA